VNRNTCSVDDELGPVPFDAASQHVVDLGAKEKIDWMCLFSVHADL